MTLENLQELTVVILAGLVGVLFVAVVNFYIKKEWPLVVYNIVMLIAAYALLVFVASL